MKMFLGVYRDQSVKIVAFNKVFLFTIKFIKKIYILCKLNKNCNKKCIVTFQNKGFFYFNLLKYLNISSISFYFQLKLIQNYFRIL